MADLNVNVPYSADNLTKSMMNNEKYSDVCFLVGDEKKKIYASKSVLALASEVFECMFYGQLKMDTSKPIEIPDLTYIGFLNMIKYIYGYKINELDLAGFADLFKAADKYLIQHLIKDLCDHVSMSLNESNCFIIYDQLVKLQRDCFSSLEKARKLIQLNSKLAFDSDYFTEIGEETLVDLLKMKYLTVSEIDILLSVSDWIDAQVQRGNLPSTESKQTLFEPFKNLIRFDNLSAEEISKNANVLKSILTAEELNSLLLHLIDRTNHPLIINYQSARSKESFAEFGGIASYNYNGNRFYFVTYLNVKQKLSITFIDTLLPRAITSWHANGTKPGPKFKIYEDIRTLDANMKDTLVDGNWSFRFNPPLQLNPGSEYSFSITFKHFDFGPNSPLSKKFEPTFSYDHQPFTLKPYDKFHFHCFKKIGFHL